jgi:hypothetical protein
MLKKIITLIIVLVFVCNWKVYAWSTFNAKWKLEYDKCSVLLQKYFIIDSYNNYNNEFCFYINWKVWYWQEYRLIVLDKISDNSDYIDIFGFRSYNKVVNEFRKYKNKYIKFSSAIGSWPNPDWVYYSNTIHENDISTSHMLFSEVYLLNDSEINELKYNLNHLLWRLFIKLNNLPLNNQNSILLTLENKINTLIIKSENNREKDKLNYIKLRIDNKYKIINDFL